MNKESMATRQPEISYQINLLEKANEELRIAIDKLEERLNSVLKEAKETKSPQGIVKPQPITKLGLAIEREIDKILEDVRRINELKSRLEI